MRWAGLALLLAVVVGIGYLVRSRRASATESNVSSYEDIKRRIRAGGPVDAPAPSTDRPVPEPASLAQVFAMADPEFSSALMDRIAIKAQRNGRGGLSTTEEALIAVWGLEAEVNNGGFDQYFFNPEGEGAREALRGLELIGARRAAAIVRRALAVFGAAGPSRSREERWRQMDALSPAQHEQLSALDDEFYAYPDPISKLIAGYCRAHHADFEP